MTRLGIQLTSFMRLGQRALVIILLTTLSEILVGNLSRVEQKKNLITNVCIKYLVIKEQLLYLLTLGRLR